MDRYNLTRDTNTANPWLTFLLNNGPKGPSVQNDPAQANYNPAYAVYSSTTSGDTVSATVEDGHYFVIENEPVTLNLANPKFDSSALASDSNPETKAVEGYHVVRAAKWSAEYAANNGSNPFDQGVKEKNDDDSALDRKDSKDYMGEATVRTDTDGTAKGYDLTAIANSKVQNFAQEALKYARANTDLKPNYVERGTGRGGDTTDTADDVAGQVTVNGANTVTSAVDISNYGTDATKPATDQVYLGYYLVGTSMGTLAALDTTNDQADITEKNDEPTVEKTVMKRRTEIPDAANADSNSGTVMNTEDIFNYLTTGNSGMWVEDTEADINDAVMFRTVVTVQQGAKGYKLHDVMERGLDLLTGAASREHYEYEGAVASYDPQVFLVRRTGTSGSYAYDAWYVPEKGKDAEDDDAVNYRFTHDSLTDGCDFEIAFEDAVPETQGKDDRVTFRTGSVVDGTQPPARRDYTASALLASGANYADVDLKDGDQIVVLYWARVNGQAAIWEGEQSITTDPGNDKYQSEVTVNDIAAEPDDQPTAGGKLATQQNKLANGNGRNDNYTVLTYGAKSHTVWDRAQVTTYGFDLTKTKELKRDGVGNDEYPLLDGATFTVRKAITETELRELAKEAWISANLTHEANEPSDSQVTTYLNNTLKNNYVEVKVQTGTSDSTGYTSYYYPKAGGELTFTEADVATEPNALALDAKPFMSGNDYVATHKFYRYKGDGVTAGVKVIRPTNLKSAHLYGLDAGIYVLTEEKAPTGYNKLSHPIVVTATGDTDSDGLVPGDLSYNKASATDQNELGSNDTGYDRDEGKISVAFWTNDNVYKTGTEYNRSGADWWSTIETNNMGTTDNDADDLKAYAQTYDHDADGAGSSPTDEKANGGVQVINQTGAELPSTGGIGTTIFYVAGTVLVVGAVVKLVAKRRMGSEA